MVSIVVLDFPIVRVVDEVFGRTRGPETFEYLNFLRLGSHETDNFQKFKYFKNVSNENIHEKQNYRNKNSYKKKMKK